ncbi:CgeB family protein [Desulfovibrio inopinatus]|uniref:CgeB family protein n=1 Tax=Desulfovibrio inopinatus TaxID=102109 RepID=UPI000414D113|nr:glycosyltransferase [Desulfovibrio inopinatus]
MFIGQRTISPVLRDGRLIDIRVEHDGKTRHLFGRNGATQERALAEEATHQPGLTVFLGSGLGQAIDSFITTTGRPVVVVDCETDILTCTGLKDRSNFSAVIWLHPSANDITAVAAQISDIAAELGYEAIHCVALPAYFRINPDFYKALYTVLNQPELNVASHGSTEHHRSIEHLRSSVQHVRVRHWPPRVLLLTSKLFLMGEVMAAFDRLHVPYRYVDLADVTDAETFVSLLLSHIETFQPDFILTVNHLGVDREGVLAELLRRLDLPLASWFVDNPELMLAMYTDPVIPNCAVFTWDADNVESLRLLGFPLVEYLPLAVDERRFHPRRQLPSHHPWRTPISFVGNSMVLKTRKRLETANPDPELASLAPDLARSFCHHGATSVRLFLEHEHPRAAALCDALDSAERRLAFETYIAWEATRLYRRECLECIMPFNPLLIGDPGWLETFSGEGLVWRWHKEVSYYDDLPLLYPLSAINFNATSMQMKGAVNQRVFDVPACKSFLITDRRRQLESLFEPGREVVVYDSPQEIHDLVRHFRDRPTERQRVAEAGHRRVVAEHTYVKRLSTLLEAMRAGFGL